jgi:Mg2+/citrate symporter
MYLVAIAWLYVALMLAITARSIAMGVLTLVFAGLLPCALVLWLFGGPRRKRLRAISEQQQSDQTAPVQDASNQNEKTPLN